MVANLWIPANLSIPANLWIQADPWASFNHARGEWQVYLPEQAEDHNDWAVRVKAIEDKRRRANLTRILLIANGAKKGLNSILNNKLLIVINSTSQ
jgi:hypothetical protein